MSNSVARVQRNHPLRSVAASRSGLCAEGTDGHLKAYEVCVSGQRNPTCPFVISTGAQRSGEIWPTIGRTLPFETRFLRYVMLRLTSVEMTKWIHSLNGYVRWVAATE